MADKYQEILRTYWGYPDFRGIQRDIIESIARGEDTLGLMPTGGGKSITFQVPALAQKGVCIVVTPLIALMTAVITPIVKLTHAITKLTSSLENMEKGMEQLALGGNRRTRAPRSA